MSQKGQTPEQKGGRPCRHCNSKKHWDYDCPHSEYQKKLKVSNNKKTFNKNSRNFKRKFKKAQTKFITLDSDAWEAFANFEETELLEQQKDESLEDSDSSSESESEEQQDF